MLCCSNKTVSKKSGNELEVVSKAISIFPTCDHFPIHFYIDESVSPKDDKKKICFRNLKCINHDNFKIDLSCNLKAINVLDHKF